MNAKPLICRAVLEELAKRYARRHAGRTGTGVQRVLFDYEEILTAAGCADGCERVAAEEQLCAAETSGWIVLLRHRRDPGMIHQIEFLPAGEGPLFGKLGMEAPSNLREAWAELFRGVVKCPVLEHWDEPWREWCLSLAEGASRGKIPPPFRWEDVGDGIKLLQTVAGILDRKWDSLIRFASCLLCNDSKRLEEMKPRVETMLAQITRGTAATLESHGILRAARTLLIHGPLRLEFPDGSFDLGLLQAPVWISEADILRARTIHTSAPRCLTVENETTMQELAKQQSGTLLIQTSYPTSAVIALFDRLPENLECWHFGDTDPWGFDILRDLRERTRRTLRPLHMNFRFNGWQPPLSEGDSRLLSKLLADPSLADVHPQLSEMQRHGQKGWHEQETLGFPQREWPFYSDRT